LGLGLTHSASSAETFSSFMDTGLSGGQFAAQVAAHAAAGGTLNMLQDGKFGHGFISAGITKALTPAVDSIAGGNTVAGTIGSSLIGGTASQLSGGKFANGAAMAAFQFLFNAGVSRQAEVKWIRSITRDIETMFSTPGESYKSFVARLGKRIFDYTQAENVEYIAALASRTEEMDGGRIIKYGAIIQTQDAASFAVALSIPRGFEPVLFKENVVTIHAHPIKGRATANDVRRANPDLGKLRRGQALRGEQRFSETDKRIAGTLLATAQNTIQYDGRSSGTFLRYEN
jgi:hypothetical protein